MQGLNNPSETPRTNLVTIATNILTDANERDIFAAAAATSPTRANHSAPNLINGFYTPLRR